MKQYSTNGLKHFYHFLLSFFMVFFGYTNLSYGQKRILTNTDTDTWPELGEYKISNNGRFIAFVNGNYSNGSTLTLKSAENAVERTIKVQPFNTINFAFTSDSRQLIYLTGMLLRSIDIGNHGDQIISENVKSFNIIEYGPISVSIYQKATPENSLHFRNNLSRSEKIIDSVDRYWFDKTCPIVLLLKGRSLFSLSLEDKMQLKLVDIISSASTEVVLDARNHQFAYVKNIQGSREIWFCRPGAGEPKLLIGKKELDPRFNINSIDRFTDDGRKIIFSLNKGSIESRNDSIARSNVKIYRHNQEFLSFARPFLKSYIAVTQIDTPKCIPLTTDSTREITVTNNYMLSERYTDANEYYWNNRKQSLYLISLSTGLKTLIHDYYNMRLMLAGISPNEKYVSWVDTVGMDVFCYQISTGKLTTVSKGIPEKLIDEGQGKIYQKEPFGIAGWLPGDSAILIYSRYDIWKVDPSGRSQPFNLTNGVGRKTKTQFRIMNGPEHTFFFLRNDEILLSAFNYESKHNGYYSLNLYSAKGPLPLVMGPYAFHFAFPLNNWVGQYPNATPTKAKYSDTYLVERSSANSSRNIFLTNNFKDFSKMSDVCPENKYNWYTNELLRWKSKANLDCEGILYKPENLDKHKKYPMIFYFYESLSNGLNSFIKPEFSSGRLDISWYVSNGYLVFVPNMPSIIGNTIDPVVDVIASAKKLLSKINYVDSNKMGLQGHSYGGYETIAIIANVSGFAAAQESSGPSNALSNYGAYTPDGFSNSYFYERGQGNLGIPPFQNLNLYIRNSPYYSVEKINTPLLMMHNQLDGRVPFSQAIELFTAMRRRGKRVWLLNYNGEAHQLGGISSIDFTIRQQEFFDHFLKEKPIPAWLTTD